MRTTSLQLVLALVAVLAICPVQRGHAVINEVTVYTSGTEGYNIFRIPTIVKAANGDLLAFAEARASINDAGSIDIVVKRSTDSGATWGGLDVVMDNADFAQYLPAGTQDITLGNQCPVVDMFDPTNPGRIWLPFALENDRVFTTYSDDNGATWATQTEITSTAKDSSWGKIQPGPVHAIQLERGLHAGRLLVPTFHELAADGSIVGSHTFYSDDHGQTWQVGAVVSYDTAISEVRPNEVFAVELVDGRVYFNARDTIHGENGLRSINYSSDGGLTYDGEFIKETKIATPKAQNSGLRFHATDQGDDENIILYASPGDPNNGYRVDLVIHTSLSETLTWTQETLIHSGRVAYTDLVKLGQDEFGVLFEAGVDEYYESILFASMDYSDLATPDWTGIQGDVNQDGVLDSADLPYFISVWTPVTDVVYDGNSESYLNGDLNFNGRNDIGDIFLMREAWLDAGLPASALSGMFQVPEPSTACLLFSSLLFGVSLRRWNRNKGAF